LPARHGEVRENEALGAQLPFALLALLDRAAWPDSTRKLFHAWTTRPKDLLKSIAELREDKARALELIDLTLRLDLDQPLSQPTEDALLRHQSDLSEPG